MDEENLDEFVPYEDYVSILAEMECFYFSKVKIKY